MDPAAGRLKAMPDALPFFDAHCRLEATSAADLDHLAFFGTTGLVTAAHDGFPGSRAEDLLAHLEAVAAVAAGPVRAAGLTGYAAVGVHPAKIPWLGLETVFARLPELLGRPEVIAVGEIGLVTGDDREEEVFRRQVELALDLRRPLVVTVPEHDRARLLRRILAMLLEADVPVDQALVTRVDAAGVATVRGVGYRVALGALAAGEAAAVVRRHGPEGLLLASDLGAGLSDPLVVSRMVAAMEKAGLSRAVLRRVAYDNAVAFFGVQGVDGWPRGVD